MQLVHYTTNGLLLSVTLAKSRSAHYSGHTARECNNSGLRLLQHSCRHPLNQDHLSHKSNTCINFSKSHSRQFGHALIDKQTGKQ